MAKSFRGLNSPEFKSQLSSFGNAVTIWTWKPGRKKGGGAEERKNGADTGEGKSQKCTLRTMARILKWFAIPFSRGLPFVRTLHHDLFVLGGPTRHGS